MDLLSQEPLLSKEEVTKGFDLEAGRRWIYPENYPIRQYQYTIAKTALFHNTLVCLPTGLGKTFIAAVVMYNYFRWYPEGIIVFLAPTKPLVGQQINACHEIMGIPISQTVELTGATNQKRRHLLWREKRVIFATPQTFQKDLEHKIVPTERIKCIVIDEAHKALGKHSYCESIRMMHERNEYFRLVALSATPGGKVEAVQEVIRNLHITHLELRDDTSPDIVPYINERKLDIILVELGQDLYKFKERYIEIMDFHVKILIQFNIIRGCTANISKGRIFHILREFRSRQQKNANHGTIMKTLNILITMYHAYELIVRHGLRAFYNFYQNHSDKFWLDNEPKLVELLEDIKQYIGPFPDVHSLIDGSSTEIPENIVFGHEKFQKLKNILIQHFERNSNNNNTRAIVFVEYRDIVNEVFVLLVKSSPLIRPQIFVGQAGLKQKAQKKALEDFRNNHVNVLISTSVGEEGLDVGEVDLIICFDISQNSPTRLVQRMGRTGRKRDGHIIVLVTDGKEHQTLKAALSRRDSLNNKVLHSSGVITALQEISPRMIPPDITPECQKIHMTIIPIISKKKLKKNKLSSSSSSSKITELNEKKSMIEDKQEKQTKVTEELAKKNNIQKGSLMKFLTTISNQNNHHHHHNTVDDIDNSDIISPTIQPTKLIVNSKSIINNNNNKIKPCDVKLLTNDHKTLEFLTLCATKQSGNNDNNSDKLFMKIPYVSNYSTEYDETIYSFYDLKIPDYSILHCIEKLEKYIEPMNEYNISDDTINTMGSRDEFLYKHYEQCSEAYDDNKFENLLNSSESELEFDENIMIESAPVEYVDWNNHTTTENSSINNNKNSNYDELVNVIEDKKLFQDSIEKSAFECLLDETSDNDSNSTQFNNDNDDESHIDSIEMKKSSLNSTISDVNTIKYRASTNENAPVYKMEDCTSKYISDNRASEIEKINHNNSQVHFGNNSSVIQKNHTIISEKNNSEINYTSNMSKVTNHIDDIDNYDWSSDFETTNDPITVSKHFGGSTAAKSLIKLSKKSTNCEKQEIKKDKLTTIRNTLFTKPKRKFTINNGSDSDDDFSTTKIEKTVFNKVQSNLKRKTKFTDRMNDKIKLKRKVNSLNESVHKESTENHRKFIRERRKIRKLKNDFIDDEAQVSSDNSHSNDNSEINEDNDEDLEDFLSYTQYQDNSIDMKSYYLQSIRSPKKTTGFQIKKPAGRVANEEIYSQIIHDEADSYLYDSFCVHENEEGNENQDISSQEITIIQEILPNSNKKRKRNNSQGSHKRKRILLSLDNMSSSEDETEKMRIAIMNSSMTKK